MPSLLSIGITGLNTAQGGLLTTGHNISNVNTEGYSRQTVIQAANMAQFTGAGFFGNGVHIETVARQYNEYLEGQMRETQASASQLERYSTEIRRIDNLLAGTQSGLSPAMDEFFAGAHEVATHPGDAAARQNMLSASDALVARFKTMNDQLVDVRNDVNSQLSTNIDSINSLAQRLADLNGKIARAAGQGSGQQPPNDLLDQRDVLVHDLNKLIRANVVRQTDGSYNVFIGTGQALVVREEAYSLSLVQGLEDAAETQVALDTGSSNVRLRTDDLPGGELGGLLTFREETLNTAQNALGRMALALAENFNEQHRLGQDLKGAMGADYFGVGTLVVLAKTNNSSGASATATISDYSALTSSDYRLRYDGTNYIVTRLPEDTSQSFSSLPQTVDGVTFNATGLAAGDSFLVQPTRRAVSGLAVLVRNTDEIAAAAPVRAASALSNAGSATISAGQVSGLPLTGHNYAISFSAGSPMTYTVSDLTASTTVATGNYDPVATTISFDNISVEISGAAAAGDTFTVGPNTNANGDNRNAIALAGLQTKAVLGSASLQGAYSQLVSTVGNKAREVETSGLAQASVLQESLAARESVSGVNLDEEAANLLRYQQAYQAASKVIAISGTLFDSIIDILG